MTITAVWTSTESSGNQAGDGLSVTATEEVDGLVARLSEPGVGLASVWHEGREPADAVEGMLDHDVLAVVTGGYGYLSYIDPEHDYAVLDGDPASPAVSADADAEFPAGSGVSPQVLARALREFFKTGQRPESVGWQEIDW